MSRSQLVNPIPGTNPATARIYCRILPGTKTPVGRSWHPQKWNQRDNLATFDELEADLLSGKCGFGLVFYSVGSHGVVVYDIDNKSGRDAYLQVSGGIAPEDESTLSWSSGKDFDGNWQPHIDENSCISVCFLLTEEQAKIWRKRKVGKGNTLDARMGTNQSVLPANNLHPSTGHPWRFVNYAEPLPLPDSYREQYDRWLYAQRPELDPAFQEQQRLARQREHAARQAQCQLRGDHSTNLVEFYHSEIKTRLSFDDIYIWQGHNWKPGKGDRVVGCCPNHCSKGGESFVTSISEGTWFCNGCDMGGGAVEYRHFLNTGRTKSYGGDFVKIIKDLGQRVGVELPAYKPPAPIIDKSLPPKKKLRQETLIEVKLLTDRLSEQPDNETPVFLADLSYGMPPIDDEAPVTEPDPELYAQYEQEMADQAKQAQAESGSTWEETKGAYFEKSWLKTKKFTPTIVLDQKYFTTTVPPENSILAIKSPMGTGKTEWMKAVMEALKDEGAVVLGYRNNLLHQFIHRVGQKLQHLHLHSAHGQTRDLYSQIACCVDSLARAFRPEDFDGKNVIVDEAMSVIVHWLNSTTLAKHRIDILAKITECFRRAKRIILLDGMLADWAVNYVLKLAGENCKVIKIENKFKVPPLYIEMMLGTLNDEEEEKVNDKSPVISAIMGADKCFVATDSQVQAEALDEILTKLGKKTLRVDSKTSGTTEVKKFMEDCTAYLTKHPDIQVVLYTPTAESGADINIRDAFTEQYCLFFGVLQVDAILQMIGRVRDENVKRIVWVAERGLPIGDNCQAPLPPIVKKAIEDYYDADALTTLGIENNNFDDMIAKLVAGLKAASKDVHYDVYAIIRAAWNYERANLRKCVIQRLRASGHSVYEVHGHNDDEAATLNKEATDQVKVNNSTDIHKAEVAGMTFAQAEAITASCAASWEEQCKVAKLMLLNRLPGIELTEEFTPEFIKHIKYDERSYLKGIEQFWMFQNLEGARRLQIEKWYWMSRADRTFLPDLRSRYLTVKTLHDIGLMEFLEPNKTWHKESPELLALVKRCREKSVMTVLGYVGKNPIKHLNKLLAMIGLKGASISRSTVAPGQRLYIYAIEQAELTSSRRVTVLNCINTRWDKYLSPTWKCPDFLSINDVEISTTSDFPSEDEISATEPVSAECMVTKFIGDLTTAIASNDAYQIRLVWYYVSVSPNAQTIADAVWQGLPATDRDVLQRLLAA